MISNSHTNHCLFKKKIGAKIRIWTPIHIIWMLLKTQFLMNMLGSIHRLKPFYVSWNTQQTNVKHHHGALPIITITKTHHIFLQSLRNWKPFSQTVKMLHVAVFERERYLYSANTSNSLAVQAAAPEARVVNSISCMFIVVARNILWLFLPASMCCRCSS